MGPAPLAPGLCPNSASEWLLYILAAPLVLLALQFQLFPPGSWQFFATEAALWGLSSGLFSLARRSAWDNCHPGGGDPPDWKQKNPAWSFESSSWVQLFAFLPFAVAMVPKCFGSEAAFRASYTYDLSAYKGGQDELWLEHVIFSSLFGFMVRDFFLHWRRSDPLLTVHHILVCFLMVSVCFLPVPGFRILAFITPVVEIGSSAYCLWCVRGWRTLYVVLMTLSNVLWILGASACTFLPPFSKLQLLLWAVGVSMACGRQLFLARELFGSQSPAKKEA